MPEIELRVPPKVLQDAAALRQAAAQKLAIAVEKIVTCQVVRRSIDARGKTPLFQLRVMVETEPMTAEVTEKGEAFYSQHFQHVENAPRVLIVGAGPAGYFAALELLELGLKPIILDRGKDVRARRRDLKAIQQFGEVNPHSNYCFGEGGAGTYSDGKLYTRSHKRGNIEKALRLLVEHGATSDILIDAHPHIGSNKLPTVVGNIRASIEAHGGEVHFDAFVTDFLLQNEEIIGVTCANGVEYRAEAVILATGHSARDIYHLLYQKKINIEAKPFALGVRIEHPQALIDQIQYRQSPRHALLPASSYSLVCQVKERGVFSFCMCPGGLIVPAATSPGELVVNGMSMSRRDSPFANSGTVVSIEMADLKPFAQHGVFAAMALQQQVEQAMFGAGDGSQKAPAQRLTDFVNGKTSSSLNDTSYIPGLFSAPVHSLLPSSVSARLRAGIQQFGQMMRGYYTDEANVVGTESRTSAPIRIPRHEKTLMHEQIRRLFPCGEGAGYAGGILSAAMDGQNVARAVALFLSEDGRKI